MGTLIKPANDRFSKTLLFLVTADLNKLKLEMQRHLSDSRLGERLKHGLQVAIVGEPNVGKSSLLNILCEPKICITNKLH